MDEYDIGKAFQAIENELMASMMYNMKRHRVEEIAEGKEWAMWQSMQLKSLERFKQSNKKRFGKQFADINNSIDTIINAARIEGGMSQEIAILDAIKQGFRPRNLTDIATYGEFFKLNDRKLNALIRATKNDFSRAETAMLRMADDQYRKIIFNAQMYANTGAGTYNKAVDMATKNFLSHGINCITYANGARHTISDYADMAIRTASKRAYLTGEGEMRSKWGISTVIVNKRGNPCPKCLPFCGKIMIDDVWSGGSAKDGPYPLISSAVSIGLYHPRCKDSHTTYFEGISTQGNPWTQEELKAIKNGGKQESEQQYVQRQADRFGRLALYSFDSDGKKKYAEKANSWENRLANPNESDIIESEYIHRSLGAKARNYDILNQRTGEIIHLAEGTRISKPRDCIMAGKGRERQIDNIEWLLNKYGGNPTEWQKVKGFGYIEDQYGDLHKVELHWYEEPTVGKVEMKLKEQPGGGYYIDDD